MIAASAADSVSKTLVGAAALGGPGGATLPGGGGTGTSPGRVSGLLTPGGVSGGTVPIGGAGDGAIGSTTGGATPVMEGVTLGAAAGFDSAPRGVLRARLPGGSTGLTSGRSRAAAGGGDEGAIGSGARSGDGA